VKQLTLFDLEKVKMKKNNEKKTILTDDELKQRVSELMTESKKAGVVCAYLAARDDEENPLVQIAFNGRIADIEALICTGITRLAQLTDMSVGDILSDIIRAMVDTEVDK
jgi:hypothetical protein